MVGRIARLAATCLGLLLLAIVAARDAAADMALCENGSLAGPDPRIVACTAAINSGRLNSRDLSAAHNNRGLSYMYKDDLDRAIADLNRAIQLDPQNGSAYFNRASAYELKGQLDRALADFDQAYRVAPGDPEVFVARCDLLEKLGRSDADCRSLAAKPKANTPGPAPVARPTYVGCHAENSGIDPVGPQGRVLSLHCLTSAHQYAGKCAASAPMTVDLCTKECASRGYALAGVQYRDWCHCGNDMTPERPSNACNMPCAGNPTQICGGQSAISVFRIRQ